MSVYVIGCGALAQVLLLHCQVQHNAQKTHGGQLQLPSYEKQWPVPKLWLRPASYTYVSIVHVSLRSFIAITHCWRPHVDKIW